MVTQLIVMLIASRSDKFNVPVQRQTHIGRFEEYSEKLKGPISVPFCKDAARI